MAGEGQNSATDGLIAANGGRGSGAGSAADPTPLPCFLGSAAQHACCIPCDAGDGPAVGAAAPEGVVCQVKVARADARSHRGCQLLPRLGAELGGRLALQCRRPGGSGVRFINCAGTEAEMQCAPQPEAECAVAACTLRCVASKDWSGESGAAEHMGLDKQPEPRRQHEARTERPGGACLQELVQRRQDHRHVVARPARLRAAGHAERGHDAAQLQGRCVGGGGA